MTSGGKYADREMGARGKARRKALGMTAAALGERLGYSPINSQHRVCELERLGTTTVRVVRQWAAALKMDPGELAFGERPKCAACASLERSKSDQNYDVWRDRALGS